MVQFEKLKQFYAMMKKSVSDIVLAAAMENKKSFTIDFELFDKIAKSRFMKTEEEFTSCKHLYQNSYKFLMEELIMTAVTSRLNFQLDTENNKLEIYF